MCDTVVIVQPDRVLFAKNSDRDANEAQVLTWAPAAEHPPGARLRCTHVEIPQARRTHAVLLSRPFWMWGAEMGANEHGVVIGNEAVFTREPVAKIGLLGMDLLRLALERAETAEEAVRVIATLLGQVGQGGAAGLENPGFRYHSSFLIADARGAFHLETSAREHAVSRVTGVCSLSNQLSLPDFAAAHRERLGLMAWGAAAATRQARTAALAEKAESLADLRALLRDHGGEPAPRYAWLNGSLGHVCMHGGGLLAASQTTASWVSELRPGRASHQATGTAAPCLSLFKPVAVDQPLDLGAPTARADATSLWWRHERLHRSILRDLDSDYSTILNEIGDIEAAWNARLPSPSDAFTTADEALHRWTARVEAAPRADTRPWWARRYWARRAAWAR